MHYTLVYINVDVPTLPHASLYSSEVCVKYLCTLREYIGGSVLCWLGGLFFIGCGATEKYTPLREPTPEAPLPQSTSAHLENCIARDADLLQEQQYELEFKLQMTRKGHVRGVQAVRSTLGFAPIEACMNGALRAMQVPRFVIEKALAVNDRSNAAHAARGLVADSVAVGPAEAQELEAFVTRLGPFLVRFGAIGILIVISVVVVAEIEDLAEQERERCKRVKEVCIDECTDDFMPSGQPDGMPYHECLRRCLEKQNCWKLFDRPGTRY